MSSYLEIAKMHPAQRQAEARRLYEELRLMELKYDFLPREYDEIRQEAFVYSMSKEQLLNAHRMTVQHEENKIMDDLSRFRNNVLYGLNLAKDAKTEGNRYNYNREHNLKVAREWVADNWKAYKQARKAAFGY